MGNEWGEENSRVGFSKGSGIVSASDPSSGDGTMLRPEQFSQANSLFPLHPGVCYLELGKHCSSCLFRDPVPSLCPPPPQSVLWSELCEAEDNLGLISVPGRHVTCVPGTQTARVLAANSSREKTEELSHLITGNGPLCVCDSVRLSDRF